MWSLGGQDLGVEIVGGMTVVDLAITKATVLLHRGGPRAHIAVQLMPTDVEVFSGVVGATGLWLGSSANLLGPH